MKKIRVGIIGQGRSGRDIHRHLFHTQPSLLERFEVVAVADPIAERCEPFANAPADYKRYADYKDMLNDSTLGLDLVVVACRSAAHMDVSIEVMEHGFNCICEKPACRTVAELDRALAVAEKTGKFFLIYQQSRFRTLFTKMVEVMKSGKLGEIQMVKVAYNGFGRRWDWQTIQDMCAGELLNTGPHPLDQIVAMWEMFGGDEKPETIFSKLAGVNVSGDAEDFVKLVISGKGHPVFDMECVKCNHYNPYTYQVYGSNGSLAASGDTLEWQYFNADKTPAIPEVKVATLEGAGRLPTYCAEKLNITKESYTISAYEAGVDFWGVCYYEEVYNALVNGAETTVKMRQVRRQIEIIEECHRQNPLPKTVAVPGKL